jgi:hypothetical protein
MHPICHWMHIPIHCFDKMLNICWKYSVYIQQQVCVKRISDVTFPRNIVLHIYPLPPTVPWNCLALHCWLKHTYSRDSLYCSSILEWSHVSPLWRTQMTILTAWWRNYVEFGKSHMEFCVNGRLFCFKGAHIVARPSSGGFSCKHKWPRWQASYRENIIKFQCSGK